MSLQVFAATLPASMSGSGPIVKKERILLFDNIRGLAVFGILFVNMMTAGQSGSFYTSLNLTQPTTGLNYYAWLIQGIFFNGTMRGLFSLCFGISSFLLLNRLEKNNDQHIVAADIYYRRLLWLLLFGLINAYVFLWFGDVLYHYAILGLFLFPFRKMSPLKLLIPVCMILAFGVYQQSGQRIKTKELIAKGRTAAMLQAAQNKLSANQAADLAKWQEYQAQNSSEAMLKQSQQAQNEQTAFQRAPFSVIKETLYEYAEYMESSFFWSNWFDPLVLFFIGMALYKSGYLNKRFPTIVYVLAGIIGTTGILLYKYSLMKFQHDVNYNMVRVMDAMPAVNIDELIRVAQVVCYVSLLVLLYAIKPVARLFNLLAPVGQMAFTNYLFQSLFMTIFFLGCGWYGKLQRYELFGLSIGFYLFQILFSHLWLKYFQFGPFEWVWRCLTYKKWQPFKKRLEQRDF